MFFQTKWFFIVSQSIFFYSAPSSHRVPSISCGTVCLPDLPCSPLNPLTSTPLYLYVLLMGGGVVLLPGAPRAPPTPLTAAPLYLSLLVGRGGFFTWSPSCTSNSADPLSLSILVGEFGVDTWTLLRTPDSAFSLCSGEEGCCCDQAPLAHPQLYCGFCSAREIQLTPHITTQISSVGYPATDLRSSCQYLCYNRNTTAQPIQIEERALSMNSFIVQRKDRYLIPCVIIVSITMLLAAPNGGVPSLSMDYPKASRHELCCSRLPFLFLILKFFPVNIFPIKLRVRMRQV